VLYPGELYHVGVVVDDLDKALVDFARRYGLTWGPRHEAKRAVWSEGSVGEVTFRTCFSVQAPHLEVIEAIPGTIWRQPAGSPLHHLGYWTDDVAHCSEHLGAEGSVLAACGVAVDGVYPTRFAYHRDPRGFYIEVVSASVRAEMEARWQPAR
jgi:hypothetical protein